MSDPAPNLCIHCRHFLPNDNMFGALSLEYGRCGISKKTINAVTGEQLHRLAVTERGCFTEDDECGPDGRFYEPDNSDVSP